MPFWIWQTLDEDFKEFVKQGLQELAAQQLVAGLHDERALVRSLYGRFLYYCDPQHHRGQEGEREVPTIVSIDESYPV